MKKEDNYLLYKSRSYGACIKAGYNLFTDNFRKLFSSTWIVVLIIALLKSGIDVLKSSITQIIRHEEPVHTVVAFLFLILLEIISYLILSGIIFHLFEQHKQTGVYSRCNLKASYKDIIRFLIGSSKLILWTILLYTPIFIVSRYIIKMMPLQLSDSAIYKYILLFILVFILIIKGCKNGLHHLGFSFAVIFPSWLITTIAVLIINMPEVVIQQASIISQNGVLEGDPSGLPGYFSMLVFVVSSVITFMSVYAGIAFCFPIYYMYGSIETQKAEKADFEKNIEQ
jgi:hypothetical protein